MSLILFVALASQPAHSPSRGCTHNTCHSSPDVQEASESRLRSGGSSSPSCFVLTAPQGCGVPIILQT